MGKDNRQSKAPQKPTEAVEGSKESSSGVSPGLHVFAPKTRPKPVSLVEFAVTVTSGQFKWLPHLQSLEQHLQAIADGEAPHETTLVLAPPRSGKSWLGCRIFPAYYLYRHPDRKIIVGAHTAGLAWRHTLIALQYFSMTPSGGHSLMPGARSGGWWETKQGGQCFSIGRDSWVLGQGYDVCLVDDPFRREAAALKQREQEEAFAWWLELARREEIAWRQKAPPRRILLQQRIAKRDLAGLILEDEHRRGRGVTVFYQPALEPLDRDSAPEFPVSADVLPRMRSEPGESTMPSIRSTKDLEERRQDDPVRFDAVFQQNPRSEGMDMWFIRDRIMAWPSWAGWPPTDADFKTMRAVRSWDLAFTAGGGDWTVGLRMWRLELRNDSPRASRFRAAFPTAWNWVLVVDDIVRRRVAPASLDRLLLNTAKSDGDNVEITFPLDPAGGKKVSHDLRMMIKREINPEKGWTRIPRVHLLPQKGSKADRAWRHKTLANRGQCFVISAPWNGSYLDELADFTGEDALGIASYDDQVDAASDAVNTIARPRRRVAPPPPEGLGRLR